jgi:transcriptional regulator with XRE-family HTH domain
MLGIASRKDYKAPLFGCQGLPQCIMWESMPNRFGEKVRYLRRQKGLTQTDVSEALAASGSHISNIEAGRKSPSLETVIRIADTLCVATDYLLRDSIAVDTPVDYIPTQSPGRENVLTLFGAKLRHLRTQRGMHQTELSLHLNLRTQAHISLLESGRKEPSIDLVLRIADFFGVSTDYLLRDALPVDATGSDDATTEADEEHER